MHQPDSLAALVVAHDVLDHGQGQQMHIVSPLDVARRAREGQLPPHPPGCADGSAAEWRHVRTIERKSDVLSWIHGASAVSAR